MALILSMLSEQPINDDLGEIVDAVPVLADSRVLDRPRTGGQVAVQAAAVAGASFVAGAAAVAVVRNRKVRKVARRRGRERATVAKVVATRSFLVDVHVLGRD